MLSCTNTSVESIGADEPANRLESMSEVMTCPGCCLGSSRWLRRLLTAMPTTQQHRTAMGTRTAAAIPPSPIPPDVVETPEMVAGLYFTNGCVTSETNDAMGAPVQLDHTCEKLPRLECGVVEFSFSSSLSRATSSAAGSAPATNSRFDKSIARVTRTLLAFAAPADCNWLHNSVPAAAARRWVPCNRLAATA